jgi:hypothetical protein
MIKTVLLMVLIVPWMALDAAELYRYYNQQGVLVTTDTPPADAAVDDYEVVSESGRVLRIVSALEGREELSSDQSKQDRYLLSSFSSVDEIQSLKARKIELLLREIEQLKNNLAALAKRENTIYFDAANIELSGEAVPASVSEQLQILKDARTELNATLTLRRQEYDAVERRYNEYIARFRQLKEDSN